VLPYSREYEVLLRERQQVEGKLLVTVYVSYDVTATEQERHWVQAVQETIGGLAEKFVVGVRNIKTMHEEEVFSQIQPFNATLSNGFALTAQAPAPNFHHLYGCRKEVGTADGSLKPEVLKEWLVDLAAGKVDRTLLSEPAPPPAKEGRVQRLVGTTLQPFLQEPHDKIIVFGESTCSGCKQWFPTIDSLAPRLGVPVGYYDVDRNEFPEGFDFDRVPTVFFVDDVGNNIKYDKDVGFASDEEDIIEFVAELKTDKSEL
jgi:hypothetical protein